MMSVIVDSVWLICQCVFSDGADYRKVVDVDVVVVSDKITISQPSMRNPAG